MTLAAMGDVTPFQILFSNVSTAGLVSGSFNLVFLAPEPGPYQLSLPMLTRRLEYRHRISGYMD